MVVLSWGHETVKLLWPEQTPCHAKYGNSILLTKTIVSYLFTETKIRPCVQQNIVVQRFLHSLIYPVNKIKFKIRNIKCLTLHD